MDLKRSLELPVGSLRINNNPKNVSTLKSSVVLLLLFNLFFSKALSQSFDKIESKISLKFAPFALLDVYNGSSLRFGTEIKLKNNYAIYSELGTFLPHSFINSKWLRTNSGIIAKGELKRYLNKEKIATGLYTSIELFYKYQSFATTDTISIQPVYQKDYTVYKNVYCATLKLGEQVVDKSGFLMDLSFGLGVRIKDATSTLTAIENNNILGQGDNSTNLIMNRAGTFIYPNFFFGVKVGYSIK